MPSFIEVPDELFALLYINATAQGKDVNTYAVTALFRLGRKKQDAVQNLSPATHSGKPLAQFINEQRKKHGSPADWGTGETAPLTDNE